MTRRTPADATGVDPGLLPGCRNASDPVPDGTLGAVRPVVRSMTSTCARLTALGATALLAAGCAAQAGSTGAAPVTSPEASLPDDGGLVLQVAYTGGFVPPQAAY